MECSSCKREYDYDTVIPLTCNCGNTICKDCIIESSFKDSFKCMGCKQTMLITSLILNRGIDSIINEIKYSNKTRKESEKPKKKIIHIGELLSTEINSKVSYQALENSEVIYVNDKQILAGPVTENRKIQTTSNFILLQKVNEKKLFVKIAWDKCVAIFLYFILTMPWVKNYLGINH